MSPLGGGIALFNMLLGEVIFGGLGCGLYGMLMFAMIMLSVLRIGPELAGRKLHHIALGKGFGIHLRRLRGLPQLHLVHSNAKLFLHPAGHRQTGSLEVPRNDCFSGNRRWCNDYPE